MRATPEVYEPDESLPRDLVAMRQFAHLMDDAFVIPGTTRRIGLDAVIGVIPGFGDAAGALFSFWIILGGIRHRVPFRVLMKMVWRVLIDLVIGAIPFLGDVFDIVFKENVANVEHLIRNRNRQKPPRGLREAGFALAVGISLLLVLAGIAVIIAVYIAIVALRART